MTVVSAFATSPPSASPVQRSGREDGARRAGVFTGHFLGRTPGLRGSRRSARGRKWRGRGLLHASALLIAVLAGTAAVAQKPADKPRVPPGVDPGGVAVAIIGGGIDYTRPEIAARLARDGEGEIIAWDFIDNDRKPFDPCSRSGGHAHCEQVTLWSLVEVAPLARVIVARVSPTDPQMHVEAMRAIAATPARVVLLANSYGSHWHSRFAIEASRRFPSLLVVATTNVMPQGADGQTEDATANPPNLIFARNPVVVAGSAALLLGRQPGLEATALRDAVLKRGDIAPGTPSSMAKP